MARHPFTYRDFRFYFTARLATTIAQTAMVIVIGWQVYDIARRTMDPRHAALQLGYVGAIQFFPLLALTLVVGWTADRIDRRWIARASVALEGCCALALAILAARGTTTLEDLFVVAALLGVSRAFAGPALQGLAPNLVPREVLPTAIALSSIAWQGGAVGGPALGGYLYAAGHFWPYAVSTSLFFVACVSLFLIRPITRSAISGPASPWRQMVHGLHYVRRNRLVLGAISLDLFAVLLGGATAMLPVYARDILKVGASGLGELRAAPALGAALTALFFAFRPLKHNVGVKMLGAVAIFGHRDDHIRRIPRDAVVAVRACDPGRGGHVLGLRASIADPDLDTGRDARARRRGVDLVRVGIERAGRGRVRLSRGP